MAQCNTLLLLLLLDCLGEEEEAWQGAELYEQPGQWEEEVVVERRCVSTRTLSGPMCV